MKKTRARKQRAREHMQTIAEREPDEADTLLDLAELLLAGALGVAVVLLFIFVD
ncbi:MAG: hypothetical protein WCP53_00230 [Verrucomicrobiota bacterium]